VVDVFIRDMMLAVFRDTLRDARLENARDANSLIASKLRGKFI
jgi:hypothetical protein